MCDSPSCVLSNPLNPNASRSPPLSSLPPPTSPLPQLPSRPLLVKLAPLSPPSPTLHSNRRAPVSEDSLSADLFTKREVGVLHVHLRRYSDSYLRNPRHHPSKISGSNSEITTEGSPHLATPALRSFCFSRPATGSLERQPLSSQGRLPEPEELAPSQTYVPEARRDCLDMNSLTDDLPSANSGGKNWRFPHEGNDQWTEPSESSLHYLKHPSSGAAAEKDGNRIQPLFCLPSDAGAPHSTAPPSVGNSTGNAGAGSTATTIYFSGNSSSSNMMTADEGSGCVFASPAAAVAAVHHTGTGESSMASDPKDGDGGFTNCQIIANRRRGRSKTCSAMHQNLLRQVAGTADGVTAGDPLRRVRFSVADEWCEDGPRRTFTGAGFGGTGSHFGGDGGGLLDFPSGQLTMTFDATSGGFAAGGSSLAPPSDAFSKGDFAFLPDAHSNMSCYFHSSHPSVSYWCASKKAVAAAAAAAAYEEEEGDSPEDGRDAGDHQKMPYRLHHAAEALSTAEPFRRSTRSGSRRHSAVSYSAALAAISSTSARKGSERFFPGHFWGFEKTADAGGSGESAQKPLLSEGDVTGTFPLHTQTVHRVGAYSPAHSHIYGYEDWRSLVGAPSSACKSLKAQQQQQVLLQQSLLHRHHNLGRGGELFGRRNSWCACRPLGSCRCCPRTTGGLEKDEREIGRHLCDGVARGSSGREPPLFDTRLLRGDDDEEEDEVEESPSPEDAADDDVEPESRLFIVSRVKRRSSPQRTPSSPKSGHLVQHSSLPPRPHSGTCPLEGGTVSRSGRVPGLSATSRGGHTPEKSERPFLSSGTDATAAGAATAAVPPSLSPPGVVEVSLSPSRGGPDEGNCGAGNKKASLWTPSSLLKSLARGGGSSSASSSSGNNTASSKSNSAATNAGGIVRGRTTGEFSCSEPSTSRDGHWSHTCSSGSVHTQPGSKEGVEAALSSSGAGVPAGRKSRTIGGASSFASTYVGLSSLARVLRPRRHSHHYDTKGTTLSDSGAPGQLVLPPPSPPPAPQIGDDNLSQEADNAAAGPVCGSCEQLAVPQTGSQKLLESVSLNPPSLSSGKTRVATDSHWGHNSEEDKPPPLSSCARTSQVSVHCTRAGVGSGKDDAYVSSGHASTQRSVVSRDKPEEDWEVHRAGAEPEKEEVHVCRNGDRNCNASSAAATRRNERRYHTAPSNSEFHENQATAAADYEAAVAAGKGEQNNDAAGAARSAAAAGSLLGSSSSSSDSFPADEKNGRHLPVLLGLRHSADSYLLEPEGDGGALGSYSGRKVGIFRRHFGGAHRVASGPRGGEETGEEGKPLSPAYHLQKVNGSKVFPFRRSRSSSRQAGSCTAQAPPEGGFACSREGSRARGLAHTQKISSHLSGLHELAAPLQPAQESHLRSGATAIAQSAEEGQLLQRGSSATHAGDQETENYDIQFGGLLVRLHRKLSAKCHCQFDVWEGEAVGVVPSEVHAAAAAAAALAKENAGEGSAGSSQTQKGEAIGKKSNSSAAAEEEEAIVEDASTLAKLHTSIVGLGKRFAIKLLEIDGCDASKLKYKTHSVLQEGKQLRSLCLQLWRSRAAAAAQGPNSSRLTAQQRLLLLQLQQQPQPLHHPEVYVQQLDRMLSNHGTAPVPQAGGGGRSSGGPFSASPGVQLPLLPIPRYLWTSRGVKKDGTRVLGVSMERIEGRSLTQILQQMRVPTKKSAALLAVEIAIKLVRAQALLASPAALEKPIINWDTKPGNVLVELTRSVSTQQLHCLRCVIIDLGDALPGPNFSFPTRHQPGVSPSYIICTKGYCSPECAILVFLLAAGSKSSAFRKVWYGQKITPEEMLTAKKQRLDCRWQSWIRNGFLKQMCMSSAPAGSQDAGKEEEARRAKGKKDSGASEGSGKSGEGGSKAASSYWEVLLSESSVVFSTGLVIGQLFGGPNLLQVVNRDEVAALDALCEWGCTDSPNVLLGRKNLHPDVLLPSQGVFAAEPWRGYLKTMLRHTLAFLPSDRWSFEKLEAFLIRLHAELAAAQHVVGVSTSSYSGSTTAGGNGPHSSSGNAPSGETSGTGSSCGSGAQRNPQ
ncbi:hypothetical protein TGME49_237510 [Toxoplasma gondii ME49]|uniref:Uncharacterized protein n=2 Tax=Toxoplasma gondii TaxID=5811 RepID=A0A086JUI2_TOXGO|nr:hypothetical protein TGME49_237510 [Toxoplasma gondii ME49]EPT26590.1 hypothetical protein TGME49_237510 [Toxoplasma gondii ME49]KFG35800.1 hypothetical protein TGDOM2_237510 [Toxoplasma gondii GAB2-2007-GAL-DOM2]|eukprot:XP_002369093.2 hypothetical protein TGME49_237510 [Toxoplasma gondii ME49]